MQGIVTKPAQLPEELGMYLDRVRKLCPSIEQVWALGPRVNDAEARHTSWELLAFGDSSALETIRADRGLERDDLVLLVVTDGDRYENAWGDPRPGRLSEVEWHLDDPHTASYVEPIGAARAEPGARATAVRVR
jgi:hypothetical protein